MDLAIKPIDWQPVGRERAQPCPFMFNCQHAPTGYGFESINSNRNINLFGRGIAGFNQGFVMRTQPQLVHTFGPELKCASNVDGQRQVVRHVVAIDTHLRDGAAFGLQAEWLRARKACDDIRPRPGGIDDDARVQGLAIA